MAAVNATGDFGNSGSSASVAAMIKNLYPQRRIEREWELKCPFWSRVRKTDDFDGFVKYVPVEHDHANVAGNHYTAIEDRSASKSVKWSLERRELHGVVQINSETIAATRNDRGGFLRILEREIGNVQRAMMKRMERALLGDSGGSLGIVSSPSVTSDPEITITLTRAEDVVNFNAGQWLKVADGADGSTPRLDSGGVNAGYLRVNSLNLTDGTIQCTGYQDDKSTPDSGTSISDNVAAGDYLFADGDDATEFRGLPHGVGDWIPQTANSSADFTGVNRGTAGMVERLQGHRLDASGMLLSEAIKKMGTLLTFTGAMGENLVAFCNPMALNILSQEMDAKVIRDAGGKAKAGFTGYLVNTPAGEIEIVASPYCPNGVIRVCAMDSFVFSHLLGAPHIVNLDGLRGRYIEPGSDTDEDGLRFTYRLWGELICIAPGKNGVIFY